MSRRPLRLALAVAALLVGALALSSCTSQTASLGHQACVQVESSLKLFAKSQAATGATKTALANRANVVLRNALPNAALAAAGDGSWQALEATLSESSRVPEKELVQALTAQCAQTLS